MAADAIVSIVLFGCLGVLIYGPWQWICADWCRQFIFERRDRLFDLAADGRLSFESVEYRDTRAGLERLIRFAHVLTIPRLLFLAGYAGFDGPREQPPYARIQDGETRVLVRRMYRQAQTAMLLMAMVRSPFFILVAPVFGCLLAASHAFGAAGKWAKAKAFQWGAVIQREADCSEGWA